MMKGRPAKRWDKSVKGPVAAIKKPQIQDSFLASLILKYIDYDKNKIRKAVEKEVKDFEQTKLT